MPIVINGHAAWHSSNHELTGPDFNQAKQQIGYLPKLAAAISII